MRARFQSAAVVEVLPPCFDLSNRSLGDFPFRLFGGLRQVGHTLFLVLAFTAVAVIFTRVSNTCRDLQNDFAARASGFGKLVRFFDFGQRQNGFDVRF